MADIWVETDILMPWRAVQDTTNALRLDPQGRNAGLGTAWQAFTNTTEELFANFDAFQLTLNLASLAATSFPTANDFEEARTSRTLTPTYYALFICGLITKLMCNLTEILVKDRCYDS